MAAGPLVFEGFERGEMEKRTLFTISAVLFGLGLLPIGYMIYSIVQPIATGGLQAYMDDFDALVMFGNILLPCVLALFPILIGCLSFIAARERDLPRRLSISEDRIRFEVGNREVWSVRWEEVEEVGNGPEGRDGPTVALCVSTPELDHSLGERGGLGTADNVKAAFRAAAERAARKDVILADRLGWAPDLKDRFFVLDPPAEKKLTSLDSGWQPVITPSRLLLSLIYFFGGLAILAAGGMALIQLLLGWEGRDREASIGIAALILGILGTAFLWPLWRRELRGFMLDRQGLTLRYNSGKMVTHRWEDINGLHRMGDSGLLLSTKNDSIWFKLSPELRKTVRLFFAMCKKDGPERPR